MIYLRVVQCISDQIRSFAQIMLEWWLIGLFSCRVAEVPFDKWQLLFYFYTFIFVSKWSVTNNTRSNWDERLKLCEWWTTDILFYHKFLSLSFPSICYIIDKNQIKNHPTSIQERHKKFTICWSFKLHNLRCFSGISFPIIWFDSLHEFDADRW